jgi:hypothetical protein
MKRFLISSGAVVLFLLLLISFWIDANNAGQGGAIDLRNRITGARIMSDGIDPYTYKWSPGEPAIYCDPFNNPHLPVSKTTSSPAMLGLTLPWAALNYRSGQYMWFVAQWGFLLGAGWLWWRECRGRWQSALLGAMLVAYTFTASWRLHAERGQSYVVLAFFLAWWLAGTLQAGKRWSFWAGFAAGTLAMLRPPCLLLLPVLAWRRRDQWLGMASGLLAGLLVPMIFLGNIWGEYGSAMQENSFLYRNYINPRAGEVDFPTFIENLPVIVLGNYVKTISYADSSVHALLRHLGDEPASGLLVFLAGAIPFGAWCWWAIRARWDTPRLLLGLACWMFLLDFFVPAYRNLYNDVLALNFIALGVLVAPRWWPALIPAVLSLAFGIVVNYQMEDWAWYIDAPSVLLALSAVLWLFAPADANGLALDRSVASRQNRSC